MPPEETGLPTRLSEPSDPTARTEIWLLPAFTARTYRPWLATWIAPCDPTIVPVPAPPAENGEPASAVREPSACWAKPPIVFVPAVLSFT